MFRLSVCADTLFRDLPFEQRVQEISRAGFLVEFWGWQGHDIDAIAADPNVQIGVFSGSIGGSLVHPDGLETYLDGVESSIAVAQKLGCRNMILLTGELEYDGTVIHPVASHPATMWITAYKGLCQVAELAEKHDVVYSLEVLNTKVDHAGYALNRVEDGVRLLKEVDNPRIKLLLDLYHVQIEEGNLTQAIRDYAGDIGHIHVADVPGRHEPGTGEINYRHVAQALHEVGYEGAVGLEAFAQSDDHKAMARFREVFSGCSGNIV